ncbi:MAG: polysaccharide biosynthesis protein [Chloroflexi bacterium]|nr:polysaccharide biosynthesis protein [Chloroflexota bacterium]MCL5275023.1 polysaccharide biosynthesis protein [Chloroflexota bacterium]
MLKHIRNRWFLLFDLLILPVAVYLGFMLRLDNSDISVYQRAWLVLSAISLIVIPCVFWLAGVYARYWPFASVDDLALLAVTVTGAVVLVCVVAWIVMLDLAIKLPPRSFPFLFLLLALAGTGAPRIALRIYTSRRNRRTHNNAFTHVLIMGAGEAGSLTAQELQRNPQLGLEAVGFLDDDPAKRGMRIRGLPVLGNRDDIAKLAQQYSIRQIIIALPTAPGKTIRAIVKLCEQAGVSTRIMPGLYELLDGKVSVNQLRKVEIEDLLRREPIKTDNCAVKTLLRGQRVLITGGGGSIGGELCRQVLLCEPAQLVVLGHGENSVFEIENELRRYIARNVPRNTPVCEVICVIADLRMPERLDAIFAQYHPQAVFHAAAHKHVPLMELNPSEAITNNIIGTRNVLSVCQRHGVEHFVMISTDKAVNPTSIMGASKRVAELLVLQASRAPISNLQSPIPPLPYVAVRFGNVLGSRGSVVLTFRQQIAAGGPVTVTHPEMRRFFMTIPEAVQLVLQAAVIGRGGEIFTLDMGEPVKLLDLAHDMIRLSGLEVGRDIEVTYSGIRPGEKLFEELFIKGEDYRHTVHEKIFIARNASSFVPEALNELVGELEAAARRDDATTIRAIFHRLIVEYQPPPLPVNAKAPEPVPPPAARERPSDPPQPGLAQSMGGAGSD